MLTAPPTPRGEDATKTIAFLLALTDHPEPVRCKEKGESALPCIDLNLKDVWVSVNGHKELGSFSLSMEPIQKKQRLSERNAVLALKQAPVRFPREAAPLELFCFMKQQPSS